MKKGINNAIDRAPFSGKFLIDDTLSSYYTIGDKGKNRQFIESAAVMTIMVGAHFVQAKHGGEAFISHFNHFTNYPEASEAIWLGVDTLYTATMGAVALRQTEHMVNLTRRHARWYKKSRVENYVPSSRQPRTKTHRKGAVALSLAVTFGGQMAGIASMHDAKALDAIEYCIEASEQRLEDIGPHTISVNDEYYSVYDQDTAAAFCNR